jgi:hypothetical protein
MSSPVQITIRDVAAETRDELAARAARRGQSMQEYLRLELERLASRPSLDEVLLRMRTRTQLSARELRDEDILSARDQERR